MLKDMTRGDYEAIRKEKNDTLAKSRTRYAQGTDFAQLNRNTFYSNNNVYPNYNRFYK